MPNPTPDDQRAPLSGPAVAPGDAVRATQRMPRQRLAGAGRCAVDRLGAELSPEQLAAIAAAERALWVGKWHGR